MNPTVSVFYHANCYDGFGAYWAIKHYFEQNSSALNVNYQAAYHGKDDQYLSLKNQLIIFADYCPKESVLLELGKNNLVLVFDHHATAQKDLVLFSKIDKPFNQYLNDFSQQTHGVWHQFDLTKSGAGIVCRYFFETLIIPDLVKYVENRDLQNFTDGNQTKYFHAFLLSQPFDYKVWEDIYLGIEQSNKLPDFLEKGKSVWEYGEQLVKNIVSSNQVYEVSGIKYALFNTTSHWAEVGEYACLALGVDYSISLTMDFSLSQMKGSVRSQPHLDCVPLAAHFGGGGHKNGSGFHIPLTISPFDIKNQIDDFFTKAKA